MEKTSNNTSKMIIVILILIIVLLAGFMCYDKLNVKKQNNNSATNNQNEKIKQEEISIKDDIVKKLYAPFSYYRYFADKEELYSKDVVFAKDLSNVYRNRLAFAYYYKIKGDENAYDGKLGAESYLLSSTLEKYYKDFFGDSVSYKPESFDSYGISTLEMKYNDSKKRYFASEEGGDATYFRYATTLYKAIKSNDRIELYEYVTILNQKSPDSPIVFYSNLDDAKKFKNGGFEIPASMLSELYGENSGEIDVSVNKIKANALQYKITFLKDKNNNYYFDKIEKVEEEITNQKLNNYIGDWYESEDASGGRNPNCLSITRISGDTLVTHLYISRTADFDFSTSSIKDNKGTFIATTDNGLPINEKEKPTIEGEIELNDNNIKLLIKKSNVSEINNNFVYKYNYKLLIKR